MLISSRIHPTIDRVVLRGFRADDSAALTSGLRAELARLLAGRRALREMWTTHVAGPPPRKVPLRTPTAFGVEAARQVVRHMRAGPPSGFER